MNVFVLRFVFHSRNVFRARENDLFDWRKIRRVCVMCERPFYFFQSDAYHASKVRNIETDAERRSGGKDTVNAISRALGLVNLFFMCSIRFVGKVRKETIDFLLVRFVFCRFENTLLHFIRCFCNFCWFVIILMVILFCSKRCTSHIGVFTQKFGLIEKFEDCICRKCVIYVADHHGASNGVQFALLAICFSVPVDHRYYFVSCFCVPPMSTLYHLEIWNRIYNSIVWPSLLAVEREQIAWKHADKLDAWNTITKTCLFLPL